MGSCISRSSRIIQKSPNTQKNRGSSTLPGLTVSSNDDLLDYDDTSSSESLAIQQRSSSLLSNRLIHQVVKDLLDSIRYFVVNNNEEEPPRVMYEMQQIASDEKGWVYVILELINKIELNDPLGPAIIALFLEECPLPTKESIESLLKYMPIYTKKSSKHKERNCFIIFSCLSEKLAGPSSLVLNKNILSFTFSKLKDASILDTKTNLTKQDMDTLSVALFGLIALEKLALSAENKFIICKHLSQNTNYLVELSNWQNENCNHLKRQIGFCSQFLLDNAFTPQEHVFGYQKLNSNDINVRLNDKDVSEYLKISPDGLEARNDSLSFESVRCTYQANEGIWYYEVTVMTNGIMQIGFATKSSKFLNYNGYGIGDDEYSVAYDGCRRLIWYNATSHTHEHPNWIEGDVLGLLLDIVNQQVIFTLNGTPISQPHTQIFKQVKTGGFFAAASFMSFQHCLFNFGSQPFKYAPTWCNFKKFSDYGVLSEDEKIMLPRKLKMQLLRSVAISEETCTLCCDLMASVVLQPCGHRGYCDDCATRLLICPVCRATINEFIKAASV